MAQGIDLSPFVPRSLIFISIPLFGTMYLAKFLYTEGVFVGLYIYVGPHSAIVIIVTKIGARDTVTG